MSERDARIAPTAHYTAYVWHRLGFPYSEHFATAKGRALFWAFRMSGEWMSAMLPGVPSMTQYLELRHRSIEHALAELSPDRIVELGAGLSRRGLTWAQDRGVPYLEVDLPHMISAKQGFLRRAGASHALLKHASKDVLAPEFEDWLGEQLGPGKRAVVIAEGLLGYFPMAERVSVMRGVAAGLRAAGGGHFLFDARAREGGRNVAAAAQVLRGAIWIATRGRGAREDFEGSGAVRAACLAAGFDHADPVDVNRAVPHLAHLRSPANVWVASSG